MTSSLDWRSGVMTFLLESGGRITMSLLASGMSLGLAMTLEATSGIGMGMDSAWA